MPKPASLPDVAAAIIDLLSDGEVWDEIDMVSALADRGVNLGPDPEHVIAEVRRSDELPLVFPVSDGFALLSALFRGRTFTHRITALEVAHDTIVSDTDLWPLCFLTELERYRRLVDGTELRPLIGRVDDEVMVERGVPVEDLANAFVWLLPSGTLARFGLGVGDIMAFTVRDEGLELTSVARTDDPEQMGRRLADILAQLGEEDAHEIHDVVWLACAEDPDFLVGAPPPLTEAIEAAGLAWDGDFLAAPGFDFDRWRFAKRLEHIAWLHQIDEDEALAVLVLKRMYDDFADLVASTQEAGDLDEALAQLPMPTEVARNEGGETGTLALVRDLFSVVNVPLVLGTLMVEAIGNGREGAAALGLLAETLESKVPRSHRASLRWLRGRVHQRLGHVLDAEEAFEAALTLDPDHRFSLFDAARYASDRGNAERGLSLLQRADARPDDHMVVLLTHFLPPERTDIGRNEPCWCGSGRKYKVCHRGHETLSLADRAAWLYQKAGAYALEGPWRDEVAELAEIRAYYRDPNHSEWDDLDEGLATDLVLFEGGAFEEFLNERGFLLPEDERLLADQWLLVERSVHEIEAVSPGLGFTARDVRTGDRVEVREGTASRTLRSGELICARLVPAGDTVQMFGPFEPVALHERDRLIAALDDEPDPTDLLALLSGRLAPPQLQNTEGDPLVLCQATLRSPDPVGLAALLDATYDPVEGQSGQWLERVVTHGMPRIRATLELVGPELHVDVNSEARLERVLAKLSELQPGLTLTAEERHPVDDPEQLMDHASYSSGGTPLDPDDPEIVTALTEFILEQEKAWLDEPIPALSGVTPREAAADPTRRPDLIRLLDSFEGLALAGTVAMDPNRLRAALNLN